MRVRRGSATRALEALAAGVGALAWRDLEVWGHALGWLVGSALRVRRAHVEESLRAAGLAVDAAPAMYASLGTSALELLWLSARRRSLADCTFIDEASAAAVDRARSAGKGLVLAASHTGNWDLAACAIAGRVPLMVVTKRLRVTAIDAFWQTARARYGVTLVEPAGAMQAGRAHLAAGGAVAMMIDQVPERREHAVRATFLGAECWVDRAPFTLAARAGAPVLVSVAERTLTGQRLSVIDVLAPPDRGRVAWTSEAATRATAALDGFVRAHPSEWLWMHRRWKSPTA